MTEEKYIRVAVHCPEHGEEIELADGVFVIFAYNEGGYARYGTAVHKFPDTATKDLRDFLDWRRRAAERAGVQGWRRHHLWRRFKEWVKTWTRARKS